MESKMSGTKQRRGTTLVELSLVIAILAMVALPFAAFVSQNLKNTLLSSTQLKEQTVLEQVMQDMEKHLRSATSMNGVTTGNISFTSRDPQPDTASLTVITTHDYTYVLANGLLTKNGTTFPDGLEAGLITSLTFPTGTGLQQLNSSTPPCYITVQIKAVDTNLGTTTTLQKTIYLRDYTLAANTCTVTFNYNYSGATEPYTTKSAAYNTSLGANMPANPARTGYTFAGWNTTANGTGSAFTGSTVVTANISVYAQWTANTYTVTFDGNGVRTPTPTFKSVTYGSTYGTLATVSWPNHTFQGWFTAATDGTQVTSDTTVTTAADHTLYQHWTQP
jgi:uncharacterized repeat protein (TIGR02543 family)